MECTRESVLAEADRLGVELINWEDAARQHVTNMYGWTKLAPLGYDTRKFCMTLRPHVVHPAGWDLRLAWRLLAHELVHWKRQSGCCLWWWVLKYALSAKFRAKEEMHAHLVDIRTGRARSNGMHTVEAVVDNMRGWYRLGSVDRQWMVDWMTKRLGEGAS